MCTITCSQKLNNTGIENCPAIITPTYGIFLVQTVANDGTTNRIDIAALQANPTTYLRGLLNQADATKRIYPIQNFKDIADERGESVYQEFADGTKSFLKQGVRTFTGTIAKVSTTWIGKLSGNRCAPNFSVFYITRTGDLVGKRIAGDSDYMYPVLIENQTFEARLVKQTDTTQQAALVSFELDITEKDEDLVLIPNSFIAPERLTSYNGLVDVVSTVSAEALTGFTIELGVIGGNFTANVPVTGLVVGDLALYNVTDVAAITPTSLTETSDGVYVVVMPTQASADVVRATFTKNGYDFTAVTANTILIP